MESGIGMYVTSTYICMYVCMYSDCRNDHNAIRVFL